MSLRYGSVCSGIEAATVAWHPLGWLPSFFSEIDKFPRAVLQHHYPNVPLHGDFTTIGADEYEAIDLLVGGTPCQSFSVAGLRGGLGDDRGNLALEFLRLAERTRPRWLVWENVPGVLSSVTCSISEDEILPGQEREVVETSDFGSLLAGFQELGYGFAYRILDAQYIRVDDDYAFAVPQRRQRVFVVGYLGDWRRAAAVLFECESLSGYPAPRRKAGQIAAPTLAARTRGGGGLGTDFELDGGLVANSGDVAYCLAASAQQSLDAETETLIAMPQVAAPLTAGMAASADRMPQEQGALVPLCFSSKNSGADVQRDLAPTLRAMGHAGSHPNAGGQLAIAIQERAGSDNPSAGPGGKGWSDEGCAFTLEARSRVQSVAFDLRGREGGAQFEGPHVTANLRAASGGSSRSYVASAYRVRRLLPVECERLQGLPDGYTDIPWRGKPHAPDGHRYKVCGNTMAANVMRWLGRRIDLVDAL